MRSCVKADGLNEGAQPDGGEHELVLPPQVGRLDRELVHGLVEAGVDGVDERVMDVCGVGLEGLPVVLQVRPQLALDEPNCVPSHDRDVLYAAHDYDQERGDDGGEMDVGGHGFRLRLRWRGRVEGLHRECRDGLHLLQLAVRHADDLLQEAVHEAGGHLRHGKASTRHVEPLPPARCHESAVALPLAFTAVLAAASSLGDWYGG